MRAIGSPPPFGLDLPRRSETDSEVMTETSHALNSPVAIVGIGCKFAGGIDDADSLWDFALRRGDGIIDIPQSRWDITKYYDPDMDAPGRMYTRRAAFLEHDYKLFDPEFFGISRREAAVLDPLQRILLQCSWEALDDAGVAGSALGTPCLLYTSPSPRD